MTESINKCALAEFYHNRVFKGRVTVEQILARMELAKRFNADFDLAVNAFQIADSVIWINGSYLKDVIRGLDDCEFCFCRSNWDGACTVEASRKGVATAEAKATKPTNSDRMEWLQSEDTILEHQALIKVARMLWPEIFDGCRVAAEDIQLVLVSKQGEYTSESWKGEGVS
jgi:hypothetical protein